MAKFYQTKKFKELNAEWAQKLADSGFSEIEHDEETLTAYSTRFLKHPSYVWELKSAYYSLCESFAQNYQFESEYEQNVWAYHTEGLGSRAIAKLYFKVGLRKNTDHTLISKLINRLERIMKSTYLAPDDDENQNEH